MKLTGASSPSPAVSVTLLKLMVLNAMLSASSLGNVLRYCRNVRPTWVKFNSKDTKESEWCSRF